MCREFRSPNQQRTPSLQQDTHHGLAIHSIDLSTQSARLACLLSDPRSRPLGSRRTPGRARHPRTHRRRLPASWSSRRGYLSRQRENYKRTSYKRSNNIVLYEFIIIVYYYYYYYYYYSLLSTRNHCN